MTYSDTESAFSAPSKPGWIMISKEGRPDEHANHYMNMRSDRVAVFTPTRSRRVQPDAREERR
jgi:hypothetical protein